jgi:methylthioribulose-1-phosphate dehydratase
VKVTAAEVRATGARLAAASARLADLGWMRGTSGNLSAVVARDPLRLAVTASGVDKGDLAADDVVVVDDLGAVVPVDGLEPKRPSAEASLHATIAAHTGAGAVVHVHALAGVVAAERWPAGVPLADIEMLKGLGCAADGEVVVPVVVNDQSMDVLGRRFVLAHRPPMPAMIIARHGMYVWGADPVEARHRAEALEWALSFALATAGLTIDTRPPTTTPLEER